ncbi:MAG: hypothetical protein BWY93_02165 [Euryarchaeota archaeon ADurb.BinA087]|nr:MAG: hypothetical protein BWY93_02165 [Euryarchaeota archaeon ADurb.BinA087]
MSKPSDTPTISNRLFDRLSKDQSDILYRVMGIYLKVSGSRAFEV